MSDDLPTSPAIEARLSALNSRFAFCHGPDGYAPETAAEMAHYANGRRDQHAATLADLARHAPAEIRGAVGAYGMAAGEHWQVFLWPSTVQCQVESNERTQAAYDRVLALHQAAVEQAKAEGRKEALEEAAQGLEFRASLTRNKRDEAMSETVYELRNLRLDENMRCVDLVRALAGESGGSKDVVEELPFRVLVDPDWDRLRRCHDPPEARSGE